MKTLTELRSEMESNLKYMADSTLTKSKKTSASNRNKFLKQVLMYIELEPKESFLTSEKERISKIIKAKESQYKYWSSDVCDKSIEVNKRKALFNKELGITTLKKQLKTINFILGKQ